LPYSIIEKVNFTPPKQVNEFEMTKAQAEKALAQHKGDLAATLKALVCAPTS